MILGVHIVCMHNDNVELKCACYIIELNHLTKHSKNHLSVFKDEHGLPEKKEKKTLESRN